MAAPQKASALQVLVVIFNISLVIFILGEHYFPPQKSTETSAISSGTLSDAISAAEAHSDPLKPLRAPAK